MPGKLFLVVFCAYLLSYSGLGVSPQPPSGEVVSTKTINFDQNQPIFIPPNGDPIEITFNVVGIQGKVWDIDLKTFIKHFTPNDLTITLKSPGPFGKEVTILSHQGKTLQQTNILDDLAVLHTNTVPPNAKPNFPFEDFNLEFFNKVLEETLWDDQAEIPVSEVKYSNMKESKQNALQPEGALDAFRGINPEGSWKLTIVDNTPNSQIGVKGKEAWEWTNDTEGFPIAILPGPPVPQQTEFVCNQKQNQFPWGNLVICNHEFLLYDLNLDESWYEFFFRLEAESTFFVDTGDEQLTQAQLTITTIAENHPFKWTFVTNDTAQAIQDASITSSELFVTNVGNNLKEIELFTELKHNFNKDLKIKLISPSQKTTLIAHELGDDKDDVFSNTFWDDQTITPATDAIYQNNIAKRTLIPEGAMALFRGENPNGKWTLEVTDTAGNNSSGLLSKWGLRLNTYVDPITPPETLPIPKSPVEITTNTSSFTNSLTHQIENFIPVEIPFDIQGLSGKVWSVNLTTFISHSSSSDLTIKLKAPSNEEVILSAHNGFQLGPFDNTFHVQQNINQPNNLPAFPFINLILPSYDDLFNGTLWDDQASITAKDEDYSANLPRFQLIPEGALDRFKGINPNGTWKVIIEDSRDNQAIKGIQSWLDGDSAIQENFVFTKGTITNAILQITTSQGTAEVKERSFTNTTAVAIPDAGTQTSDLQVQGLGTLIEQVQVYTKITHPKSGQLDIHLISPSGKTVVLSTGNGGDTPDIFNGTIWNDRANSDLRVTALNPNNPTEPLLIPEGKLALLRGENPNGKWTLSVTDTKTGGAGNLKEWGLIIRSYVSSINTFPTNQPPPPPPPQPFNKGNAPIIGKKGNVAYFLKQENGKALGDPITLGPIPAHHKIVAANYFTTSQSNQVFCVILQNKTKLLAKAVGENGSSFGDAPLLIPPLADRRDKVVASGDMNGDGFADLITQGRKKGVKILSGPDFTMEPLTNDVRKFGKVVAAADGKILTRKKAILYSIKIASNTNDITPTSFMIGNGLKSSLRICGAADILKRPGLELIIQEGKRIGYGPLNLNNSFGYLTTNNAVKSMGTVSGPK